MSNPYLCSSFSLPLTASQIHKVELSHSNVIFPIVRSNAALNGDDEDSMRPGTMLIHVGRPENIEEDE